MTQLPTTTPPAPVVPPRRTRRVTEVRDRGAMSAVDLKRPLVRRTVLGLEVAVLLLLFVTGAGPVLWSARAAVTPSNAVVSDPMTIWAAALQPENLPRAWTGALIGPSLLNTVIVAVGATFMTLFVSATAGYVLSVLRPKWGPALSAGVLATLFLPGVISLVPLYLTVQHLPVLGLNLLDTFWGVWLPAGASAFNVVVLKRFFDSIPRELMEAAKIDGGGPIRVFVSIVLPLSRPILGVVALLTFIASWKDYLWPLLVLSKPALQPVSVALGNLGNGGSPLSVQLAAVFLTIIVPVVVFIVFQRQFLNGVGAAGGIKG